MKCPKCDEELKKGVKFCPNCGEKVVDSEKKETAKKTTKKEETKVEEKTNDFALAGFIVSLVNILCCGAFFWVALGLSIAGLIQINNGQGKGKELAVAGIALSAFELIILIIISIIRTTISFSGIYS